jgi:hypothetical protein
MNMEARKVNNLIIGMGCLIVAFAFYFKDGKGQKTVLKESSETKTKDYVLSEKFKNKVKQMSDEELDEAIESNTKYLETSKMLPETREAIEQMLDYLIKARG